MQFKALLFVAFVGTAHGGEPRAKVFQREGDSIRTARKVVADEFAGYPRAKHQALNAATMVATDLDDLAKIIQGPELAAEPTDEEVYGCFVPHHSFLVTDRDGKSYRILVCLDCHRIVFQGPHGTSFPFTVAARDRLRGLFQRLKLPTRTSEEYLKLDFHEQQRTK